MDMQTLMDIYAEPFYRSIHEANLGSIMAAFNAVNNSYCFENKYLLNNILRDILGFKGFVMSDWWSIINDDPISINSGIDLNMPGGKGPGGRFSGRENSYWTNLEKYVKENKVTEKRINEAASRIIASMHKMDQMNNYPKVNIYNPTNTIKRKQLQRKASTESQVLLKNDGILPLKTDGNIKKIAIIGNDAFERECIQNNLYQCVNDTNKVFIGNVPIGYGSGITTFEYLITPLEGISNLAKEFNIDVVSSGKLNYIKEGEKIVDATEDIETGVEIAKNVDVPIIFVKAVSGEEGFAVGKQSIGDRKNLDLWYNANELIENITEVNKNVIVVINAPATVNLPWLDKVKGVIFSGFPGAETGNAIADILFGKVNPSGHLPFVWGKDEDYAGQIPNLENLTIINESTGKTWKDIYRYDGIDCYANQDDIEDHDKEQYYYTEGLYIGQRWFNKENKSFLFPFGYGLSYTTFEYSDISLKMDEKGLTAEMKIKNTGDVEGKAVAMMFLTFPESIGDYPKYILKGFDKIEIQPGQTKTLKILADEHSLSYFNVEQNKYVRIKEGKIKVYISDNGDPSQVKLSAEINANY